MHRPRGPFVWLEAGTSRAFYSSTVYIRIYPVCSSSVHRCAFRRLCSMSPPPPPLLLLRLLWHLLALILPSLLLRPGQAVLARTLISIPSTLPLLFFLWPRPRSRKTRSARDRLACSSAHPRRIILSRVWRDFPPHTLFLLPLFFAPTLFLIFFSLFLKREKWKERPLARDGRKDDVSNVFTIRFRCCVCFVDDECGQ